MKLLTCTYLTSPTNLLFAAYDSLTGSYDIDNLLGRVQELTARFSSHVDVVFPLNFIVVELEMVSAQSIYANVADKNAAPKMGRVYTALASGGVPLASLATAYSDMIWQTGTAEFKLHLVRVLWSLMSTWIRLVETGTLQEGQSRLLRSNRVRANVERLLAELPKFGAEGAALKDLFRKDIEKALM